MNNHLTPEQISRCLAGDSTGAEEAHARDCAQCAAELDGVRLAFSRFRATVVNWADRETASNVPDITILERVSHRAGLRRLRIAAVAAAIAMVAAIPVYKKSVQQKHEMELVQESTYDTELLERVNAHLSRTAPVSLEPLMEPNTEGER